MPSPGNKASEKEEGDGQNEVKNQARVRAIAMQHALSIEEKKKLQSKVLDMILVAYDLPSADTLDPAHPAAADVSTFRNCLALFRPDDLDELVEERNIDDRCGYALCSKPHQNTKTSVVWDNKAGKMVTKTIADGRWCSSECLERNSFVRSQLSIEPAWLRQSSNQNIRLLSDSASGHATNEDSKESDEAPGRSELPNDVQDTLALERGEPNTKLLGDIPIRERQFTKAPEPPQHLPEITVSDVLEGLPLQNIGRKRRDT